jgi:hypothetical protein
MQPRWFAECRCIWKLITQPGVYVFISWWSIAGRGGWQPNGGQALIWLYWPDQRTGEPAGKDRHPVLGNCCTDWS